MIPNVDMSRYDQQGCLHDMLARQARETPDKVAVVSSDGSQMTFGELNRMADALAGHLRSLGVRRNTVVGILMERCAEYTVCYIAILKAGGAYLPIEMSYPATLIDSVLEDAQPAVICTKGIHKHRLNTTVPIVDVESSWLARLKETSPCTEGIEKVTLDDMAYTVYSSGTTGKPKGIQCPHRGAVFSYTWRHLAYPYEQDDREACNVFFVWEMMRPLLKGIPLYIIPDTVIYDPPQLMAFLRKNSITRMLFTPSLLQMILDTQKPEVLASSFKSMRQIWLCGEVVTTILRNRIASAFPWLRILNLYSISECHDVSCSDLTESIGLEARTYCPVGKLFPHVRVRIMDENFNEKPIGDAGEIYIGGPALAIGYLNRPDLNEQRFVKSPDHLASTVGPRLYKTGDWGYLLSDGSLEVIGRCDSMVKIRGYTVELKAVENALLHVPGVSMACAVVVGSEGSDKMLVAYVVPDEGFSRNAGYLRAKLKTRLPFYMIPLRFIFLDRIPILDTTGKTNVKELPEVRPFNEDDVAVFDEPMDENAKSIARVWCKVLKLCTIDVDDNFFDLGGHSLLAAIVVSQINDILDTTLTTFDLFANPTVKALSSKVRTGENSDMPVVDLAVELKKYAVQQVPSIKLRTFWKSVKFSRTRFERGNVLLTGAAGFLGSFVLQNLLKNTEAVVYCLVRSSSTESAEERISKVLTSRGLSLELLNTRVVILTGDISLGNFGLEETDYAALCLDIDVVVHCAAYVNMVLPYTALGHVNVTGTHNVVSFCLEEKLKPLHHISTNDVFAPGMNDCRETADMHGHVEKLAYGYSQTKWLAEQIVMSASQNGLPTVVSRCGNISGCRNSATWNDNDMTLLILQSVILSGAAPDIQWQIEFTPVDFTSDVIVRLTKNITKNFGKVYHLVNSSTVNCRSLWELLRAEGYQIKMVSYAEWIEAVTKASLHSTKLESLLHLLNARLSTSEYLVEQSTFNQENLTEFLISNDMQYPQTNEFLMTKYLQNLVAGGYIPPSNKSSSILPPMTVVPRLKGKVAFVTGASSGIGCGIATALARAGVTTIGMARSFDKLSQLQKALKSENVDNFVPVKVDITNRTEVFACVRRVQATVGPVDILINCAGVMEYCKMVNVDLDLWLNMVNVNCAGFSHAIAAVLPQMKDRQTGHIVNITSDAGRKPFMNLAVYSGTKFFQEAVSEAMRQEVAAFGIKVSCIQPGDVSSGLHQKSRDQETCQASAYDIEYLKVADVVNAVLFVLNQSSNCAVNTVLVEPLLGPI